MYPSPYLQAGSYWAVERSARYSPLVLLAQITHRAAVPTGPGTTTDADG